MTIFAIASRTILGSFCYSVYIVLLRRRVSHEDNMDSPMFFGFVGMFNALLLWPGILGLHFSGKENFEVTKCSPLFCAPLYFILD